MTSRRLVTLGSSLPVRFEVVVKDLFGRYFDISTILYVLELAVLEQFLSIMTNPAFLDLFLGPAAGPFSPVDHPNI